MKPLPFVLAVGMAQAALGPAVAQERPRTLNDARSDVIHGSGGITLFDFGRKSEPPAAAAPATPAPAAASGGAPAPTSGWGTPVAVPAGSTARASTAPAATPSAAAPAARKPLFGNLGEIFGPPSGEPLSSAKKHESPSSGIALPTGR